MKIRPDDIAKLLGRVFLEQSRLNLLSTVLDTPDFFYERDVPDQMQSIYEKVGMSSITMGICGDFWMVCFNSRPTG